MPSAFAGDLEWSGLYRIEGQSIQNPQFLSGSTKNKDYGVHHLIMRPKIVAADGLYIQGQFHILNNNTDANGNTVFGGPQLGSVWGNGLGYNSAGQENQGEESFAVSEFYVSLAQEFGSLIAGRAPLEFGLGMTYDAGKGLFDHYYTNRDLVGYKIVMGNFYFTPMYAKVDEGQVNGGLSSSTDINELILHFQYENPEANVAMGVMYNNRTAGAAANTTAVDAGSAFAGYTPGFALNIKNLSIYYEKEWTSGRVGFEVLNQTGEYGVQNLGANVEANAIALALEYDHAPQEKRLHWGIRAGWASGDDPTTGDEYEGVQFHQNYDVGVLLFNHAMGQANLMRSEMKGTRYGTLRNGSATTINSTSDDPDIEAVGNAYYFAPRLTYKWRDRWDIRADFVTGWLDQADFGTDSADKGLGYEVDLSLVFKPNERLVWENTFAAFMPGTAWEVDTQTFSTSTAYGFVSRAAISF
jgi:hypothetical protein